MAEAPASSRPKVTESAIAGAIATVMIWAWNIKFPEISPWHATDLIVGAWVTLITWLTGPLIRKYQHWAESGELTRANQQELGELLYKLRARVDTLELQKEKEKEPEE